jgi:large subunit ribosomal protein L33
VGSVRLRIDHRFWEGEGVMAKPGKRVNIKLQSSASPHCYFTQKNKQNTTERLTLRKYDPVVRKHVDYKESK